MAKLRVGVFETQPDAQGCFRNLPKGVCDAPGVEVEIFNTVMTILGLDYVLVDIVAEYGIDYDYGSYIGNGNWSGMIGLLMNGSIDLTALTIRMTPERAAVIDFAFPLRYYQTVYIFKTPTMYNFQNFIFSTFTTEVWIIFFLCIASAYALHFVCLLLLLPHHHTWSYKVEYAFNMIMDERERYWCCSFLTKTYVFSVLIMSIYYQSALATNLAAPSKTQMPFQTQDELVVLLNEGKCHLTYFYNTTPPCFGDQECDAMESALEKNPIRTFSDQTSLMNDLWYNGGIYFGSQDIDFMPNSVSVYDANDTILMDTSNPMYYVSYGFATSQKLLRQRFNAALISMLMGVSQIKLRPVYNQIYQPVDGSYSAEWETITLEPYMQQLFVLWAVAIGGVLVCLVIELLWFYRTRLAVVQRTISVWQSRFGFGWPRWLKRPAKKEELVSPPLHSGFAPFPAKDEWWMSDEANNRALFVPPVRRRSTRIDENMSFFTYPSSVSP